MVACLLILACRQWPDEADSLLDARKPVAPGEAYVQPVFLSREGLYRADVALFREGDIDGELVLRLTADSSGTDEIAVATVPADRAEDVSRSIRRPCAYVVFEFAAHKLIPAARVWLWFEARTNASIVLRGTEGTSHDFRLALKVYYRRSLVENAAILLSRLGDKGSYLGVVVLLYGILLASVYWTCWACQA